MRRALLTIIGALGLAVLVAAAAAYPQLSRSTSALHVDALQAAPMTGGPAIQGVSDQVSPTTVIDQSRENYAGGPDGKRYQMGPDGTLVLTTTVPTGDNDVRCGGTECPSSAPRMTCRWRGR